MGITRTNLARKARNERNAFAKLGKVKRTPPSMRERAHSIDKRKRNGTVDKGDKEVPVEDSPDKSIKKKRPLKADLTHRGDEAGSVAEPEDPAEQGSKRMGAPEDDYMFETPGQGLKGSVNGLDLSVLSARAAFERIAKAAEDLKRLIGINTNTQRDIKTSVGSLNWHVEIMRKRMEGLGEQVVSVKEAADREMAKGGVEARGNAESYASKAVETKRQILEAKTREEYLELLDKKWEEDWFVGTTIVEGNPLGGPKEADLALVLVGDEWELESGIGRQFRDRFPELSRIKEKNMDASFLRIKSIVQLGEECPQEDSRLIFKIAATGTADENILDALMSLKEAAKKQGSRLVALPVADGAMALRYRKLMEFVFRGEGIRGRIHVPPGKRMRDAPAGNTKTTRLRNTEVLIIKRGNTAYSDMLKEIKTVLNTSGEDACVKGVRKTRDGRLLVAFKKGEPGIGEVRNKLAAGMKDAEITSGGEMNRSVTLHIKGMDALVRGEDVAEALKAVAQNGEDIEVGTPRPMFGDSQAVTVKTTKRAAEMLLRQGRLRIGINYCTIEERTNVIKCYRCWDFGHVARECRGTDRTNVCNKCGQGGHRLAQCPGEEFCVLCTSAGHRSGYGSCPKFREALRKARNRGPGHSGLRKAVLGIASDLVMQQDV